MFKKFISRNFGNTHLAGFKYLIRACELYEEKCLITLLYKTIGKEFYVSSGSVERDIRYYISRMKKEGTHEALKIKLNGFKNREVISAIVFTVEEGGEDE